MKIEISIPEQQLKSIEQQLENIPRQAPHIIRRALNRGLTTMQTTAKKEVRNKYHIKAGHIQEHLSSDKATTSDLQVRLSGKGRPIPLDRFKYAPTTVNHKRKKPVTVAVKKDGNKVLPGAFVKDVNGNKIFKREGKKRLPIKRLYGPSLPQMMGGDEMTEAIKAAGLKTFETRTSHEISRLLERGASR